MKLKPEIKSLWIKALESGKYKHGKHHLRNVDNTHCCLGVLCDLYDKQHDVYNWDPSEFNDCEFFMGEESFLPDNVADWAVEDDDSLEQFQEDIAEINDDRDTIDYSNQIQYIRENA